MTTTTNIHLNHKLRLQIKNAPECKPQTYNVIAYMIIDGTDACFTVSRIDGDGSSREVTMTLTPKGDGFVDEYGCEFVIAKPDTRTTTKIIAALACAILTAGALSAGAQVSTDCTTNGSYTHCNSVDYGAQQRQAYEAGQQAGTAIGLLINRGIIAHQVHKRRDEQCRANGVGYHWLVEANNGWQWDGTCTAKQAGVKTPKVKP
jgi:hypothetical protein